MTRTNSFALCARAQENLKKLNDRRNLQMDHIGRLEDRLRYRDGEVRTAKNRLSRTLATIENVGGTVVGLSVSIAARDARGAAKDATVLAVQLSNQLAAYNERLESLLQTRRHEQHLLRSAKQNLVVTQNQIDRAHNILDSNDCH
ncbi:MAG: hypothetical protein K0U74_03430 [Alphaproteobacteria bacterium]|nr:hypothetical protein [Alphaproteobacteria bacterium]